MIKTIGIEIILLLLALFVHLLLSDRNFKNGCELERKYHLFIVRCSYEIKFNFFCSPFLTHKRKNFNNAALVYVCLSWWWHSVCIVKFVWLMAVSQKTNFLKNITCIREFMNGYLNISHISMREKFMTQINRWTNKREKNINTFSTIFHNSHIWHFSGCKYFSTECYLEWNIQ